MSDDRDFGVTSDGSKLAMSSDEEAKPGLHQNVRPDTKKGPNVMLWTITVVLLVSLAAGRGGAYSVGAWLHIFSCWRSYSVIHQPRDTSTRYLSLSVEREELPGRGNEGLALLPRSYSIVTRTFVRSLIVR